jgi:2Fe-2S ferredoxin
MAPRIHWPQFNKTIEVPAGQTVLEAAIENDIPLQHACGGYCACTTCHIVIKEGMPNLAPMEDEELDRLEGKHGLTEASRLGCQSKVTGDIVVEIP